MQIPRDFAEEVIKEEPYVNWKWEEIKKEHRIYRYVLMNSDKLATTIVRSLCHTKTMLSNMPKDLRY